MSRARPDGPGAPALHNYFLQPDSRTPMRVVSFQLCAGITAT